MARKFSRERNVCWWIWAIVERFLGLVCPKFQRHAIRALRNSPGERLRQPSGLIFESHNENCWLDFGFETREAMIMTARKIELLLNPQYCCLSTRNFYYIILPFSIRENNTRNDSRINNMCSESNKTSRKCRIKLITFSNIIFIYQTFIQRKIGHRERTITNCSKIHSTNLIATLKTKHNLKNLWKSTGKKISLRTKMRNLAILNCTIYHVNLRGAIQTRRDLKNLGNRQTNKRNAWRTTNTVLT